MTSVVLGNCGFGFAPVKPAEQERCLMMMTRTEQIPYESMKEGMPFTWETLPQWLDALDRLPKGVNVVSYVPVSPLMVYVMGLEASKSRPATPAERAEMQRLLNEAMDAGACGFSLQRLGEHSLQADVDGTPMPTDTMADEDVLALAEVLRDRDEGFVQITQAQGGDPMYTEEGEKKNRDRAFVERLAETAQRPILHNAIAAVDGKPWLHEKSLGLGAQVQRAGPAHLRPGLQRARLVQLLDGRLEPLRLQPGLERSHARHDRGKAAKARRSRPPRGR